MKNHVSGGLTFTFLPNTPTACFPCTHAFLLLFNCHSPASASAALWTWPAKGLLHSQIVSNLMLEYNSKTHISHSSNRQQEIQNLSLYFLILFPDCGAEGSLLAKQAHCCRLTEPPWINLYWRQETLLADAWKEFQRSLWKADGEKKMFIYYPLYICYCNFTVECQRTSFPLLRFRNLCMVFLLLTWLCPCYIHSLLKILIALITSHPHELTIFPTVAIRN